MYEHILLPLDGTTLAEQALATAASIARRRGAHVHLARVVQLPGLAPAEAVLPTPSGEIEREYLATVAARLRDAGVGAVSAEVSTDVDVAQALEERRAAVGADLTVMSTHGRGPVQRAWLGSVADRYVRMSRAPVLLVRAVETSEPPDPAADVAFEKIMIPVDGSLLAEEALAPAIELGRLWDARLTIVRLAEMPVMMGAAWYPAGVALTPEDMEAARARADRDLDAVDGRLRALGVEADRVSRLVEHVATGIVACAEELGADLVAMATHGRGGLRRLALGSVADKVLRAAPCPVLVVRPVVD